MSNNTSVKRVEYPYLDGMRALAALYVVIYHAYLMAGHRGDTDRDLPWLGWILNHGYLGVPVFIVLSGYVLMLPALSNEQLRLPRGKWSFVKRRARRILPPYYAALVASLALIYLVPVMGQPNGSQWDSKLPVTPAALISHLFLLHDASYMWIHKINGPLWSVAVEWQIYFVFALALLPLWRRLSPYLIVAVLLVVTLPMGFLHFHTSVHPWLLALFAVGMLAAQLTVRPIIGARVLQVCAVVLAAALAIAVVVTYSVRNDTLWLTESLAGLATGVALVLLGRQALNGRVGRVAGFLQSRPMLFLGLISYSIYLFHQPFLALGNSLLLPLGLPTWALALIMFVGIVPLTLAACAGMFWLVERHFLNAHQTKVQQVVEPTYDADRVDIEKSAAGASSGIGRSSSSLIRK
ncbi:acyltransferase [Micromonospora purpureochromogenes]|uniref:acyltransferase family protein n=1 Tax=Micromonospora purpureochromogenes TaxID=47872 RepID=UPI00340D7E63